MLSGFDHKRRRDDSEAFVEPSLKAPKAFFDSLDKNSLSCIMDHLTLEDLLLLRGLNKQLKAVSEEHRKWVVGLSALSKVNGFNICKYCESTIPPPNPALAGLEGTPLCDCDAPSPNLCSFAATNDVR